jgi:hypothetical protein
MAMGIVAIGLAACNTASMAGVGRNVDGVDISAGAASAIAGDLVSKLAEEVGPGTGTIVLAADGTHFGAALETRLTSWGYAVADPDQELDETKIIPLSYALDEFEGGVLVRLSTEAVRLGRLYSTTGIGAVPSSPLSVLDKRQVRR